MGCRGVQQVQYEYEYEVVRQNECGDCAVERADVPFPHRRGEYEQRGEQYAEEGAEHDISAVRPEHGGFGGVEDGRADSEDGQQRCRGKGVVFHRVRSEYVVQEGYRYGNQYRQNAEQPNYRHLRGVNGAVRVQVVYIGQDEGDERDDAHEADCVCAGDFHIHSIPCGLAPSGVWYTIGVCFVWVRK